MDTKELLKDSNNNLPAIRKAEDLSINFPQNRILKEKEQDNIKKAVKKGGIVSSEGRCYINKENIPQLLVTDKKAVAKIYNNAQENDKYEDGSNQYLSISEVNKNIDERIQQPRGALEHERFKYAQECINALRDQEELVLERHIEADRIAKDRSSITKKKIKENNITQCQLSGEVFENDARGHHIERVADDPRKARDLENIIVVKDAVHKAIHNKGAESRESLKEFIKENEYETPDNLK